MEFVKSTVKRCDMIGIPVKLKFMGSSTVKTIWGGFLTLILTALLGILVFNMGRDLFSRDSPLVRQSSKINEESVIDLAKFPIVLYFASPNKSGEISEDTAFKEGLSFSAEFYVTSRSEEEGVVYAIYQVGMVRCSNEMLGEYASVFNKSSSSVNMSWCLDSSDITNIFTGQKENPALIIKNEFGSSNSASLTFNLHSCDQKKNPGCMDKLKSFGVIYMGVAFADSYLDVADYTDPVKSRVKFNSHAIGLSFSFRRYFALKMNDLISDSNLFFSSNTSISFISTGNERLSVDLYSPDQRHLYSMVFDVDQLNLTTFRKYLKIQDLLASIGGLAKAAFVFAQLFAYNFSEYTLLNGLNEHLVRKSARQANEQRIPLRINENRVEKENNERPAKIAARQASNNRAINCSSDSINVETKKNIVQFSFGAYLLSLFPTNKRKSKLYLRKIELEQCLDVLFIAEKLQANNQT